MTDCDFSLVAKRPDGYFPNYLPGQLAILVIRTGPNKQVNRKVYRKRRFRKLGEQNWVLQEDMLLGNTDENGVFIKYAYLPDDPNLIGDYQDTYFDPECSREDYLNYTIHPKP